MEIKLFFKFVTFTLSYFIFYHTHHGYWVLILLWAPLTCYILDLPNLPNGDIFREAFSTDQVSRIVSHIKPVCPIYPIPSLSNPSLGDGLALPKNQQISRSTHQKLKWVSSKLERQHRCL